MNRLCASVSIIAFCLASTMGNPLSLVKSETAFSLFPTAQAATLSGITMEDTRTFEGKNLVLNGLGLRKKAIFNVYVGGLYVEKKSKNADEIMNSPDTKVIDLKFMRNVDADSIRSSWKEGFDKNCRNNCAAFKNKIEELNTFMVDMKKDQTMTFMFTSDTLAVWVDGAKKGEIKEPGLPSEVLAIFLGKNPPNADLKKGMLGG